MATEHAYTFGLRVFGAAAGWNYDAEGIGQVGTSGSKNMRTWTLKSGQRLHVCGPTVEVASRAKGRYRQRRLPPARRHAGNLRSALLQERLLQRRQPLPLLQPGGCSSHLQFTPRETVVVLGFGPDLLWHHTANDGIYSPSGNIVLRPKGHGSHYLGTTVEATAEWRVDRHLTISLAYVYFFGGEYVKEVRGGDVSFFSATASFLFRWLSAQPTSTLRTPTYLWVWPWMPGRCSRWPHLIPRRTRRRTAARSSLRAGPGRSLR